METRQYKVFDRMRLLLKFAIDRTLLYKFSRKLEFPIDIDEEGFLSMQSDADEDFDKISVAFAETIFSVFGDELLYHPLFKFDKDPDKLIEAMDLIMRALNNEELFYSWIADAVPDDTKWEEGEGKALYANAPEDELRDVEKTFFTIMKLAALDDGSEFGKDPIDSKKSDLDFKKWIWVSNKDYSTKVSGLILKISREVEPDVLRQQEIERRLAKYYKRIVKSEHPHISNKERFYAIIDELIRYLNTSIMTNGGDAGLFKFVRNQTFDIT